MYSAVTRSIRVSVTPIFLEEQSTPEDDHYVWAYQVNIRNDGPETVQLLSRHWMITDATGYLTEVEGEGVVGEQPTLPPGSEFDYTSGCPLNTPSGIMVGTYEMQNERGEAFDVAIPAFSLDSPHEAMRPN